MISRYKDAILLYNPAAGRNRRKRPRQLQTAKEELERAGMKVRMEPTSSRGSATELAREAVQGGAELIVVCGGDGTINEAVNGMALSPVPLAILPGGTANILARELQMPLDMAGAVRALATATPRRISLGRAAGRYFLLMAGVGLDARVLDRLRPRPKDRFGMTSYVFETIRYLLSRRPVPFLISAAGQYHQVTFACISKSRHYGPFEMVREADLFSDQFYVYCFHSASGLRYFLYALALLANSAAQLPDFSRFPACQVECQEIPSRRGQVLFQVDGELIGHIPCTIEMVSDALTLLAPAPAAGMEAPRR